MTNIFRTILELSVHNCRNFHRAEETQALSEMRRYIKNKEKNNTNFVDFQRFFLRFPYISDVSYQLGQVLPQLVWIKNLKSISTVKKLCIGFTTFRFFTTWTRLTRSRDSFLPMSVFKFLNIFIPIANRCFIRIYLIQTSRRKTLI